ncbi:MAG: hypothetical protein ACRD16_11375 [Thermoanaerobaculia bacterium]
MKILDFRLAGTGARSRASARIVWEDSSRRPFDAYFEGEGIGAPRGIDPNPFLTAAFIPALRAGELRVRIEDLPVCPVLVQGLLSAAALLGSWYGHRNIPKIEAPAASRPMLPAGPAALFLSGGADSLHLLFQNRSRHPETSEESFRDAIHFLGMALYEEDPGEAARNLAQRALETTREIARSSRLTLRSVASNVAALSGDHLFWATHTQGAMLASTALGLPIRSASLAASWDSRKLPPWGSHPSLDPLYSSSSVQVRHRDDEFTRLEKIRALADWPLALENMLVCHEGPLPPGELNCGRCEKCVRTMTELLIAGALDRATAFPVRRVTAEVLDALAPTQLRTERFWGDLPAPLEAAGRKDLAGATRRFLVRTRRQRQWEDGRGLKGRLREIDRIVFGSAVSRLRRWTLR